MELCTRPGSLILEDLHPGGASEAIIRNIFRMCDVADVFGSFARVSKGWYRLSMDPMTWTGARIVVPPALRKHFSSVQLAYMCHIWRGAESYSFVDCRLLSDQSLIYMLRAAGSGSMPRSAGLHVSRLRHLDVSGCDQLSDDSISLIPRLLLSSTNMNAGLHTSNSTKSIKTKQSVALDRITSTVITTTTTTTTIVTANTNSNANNTKITTIATSPTNHTNLHPRQQPSERQQQRQLQPYAMLLHLGLSGLPHVTDKSLVAFASQRHFTQRVWAGRDVKININPMSFLMQSQTVPSSSISSQFNVSSKPHSRQNEQTRSDNLLYLRSLNLSRNDQISMHGLSFLLSSPTCRYALTTLTLDDVECATDGLLQLVSTHCSKLERLSLRHNSRLTIRGVLAHLGGKDSCCRLSLKYLSLANCKDLSRSPRQNDGLAASGDEPSEPDPIDNGIGKDEGKVEFRMGGDGEAQRIKTSGQLHTTRQECECTSEEKCEIKGNDINEQNVENENGGEETVLEELLRLTNASRSSSNNATNNLTNRGDSERQFMSAFNSDTCAGIVEASCSNSADDGTVTGTLTALYQRSKGSLLEEPEGPRNITVQHKSRTSNVSKCNIAPQTSPLVFREFKRNGQKIACGFEHSSNHLKHDNSELESKIGLPYLETLDLSWTDVEDNDIDLVLRHTVSTTSYCNGLIGSNLTSLRLSHCRQLTDYSLSSVQVLLLSAPRVISAQRSGRATIATTKRKSSAASSNLSYLDISSCHKVTNRGIRFLGKGGYGGGALATLDIRGCYKVSRSGLTDLPLSTTVLME